jgi:hypothetical protein
MIQMKTNLIKNIMNQMQHLREEEELLKELLSSKGGQEATQEDIPRKENQKISTSCLSMLTQELIKRNQM